MNRLEAIKARADAATEGPWVGEIDKQQECWRIVGEEDQDHDGDEAKTYVADVYDPRDKDFIVDSLGDIAWLRERVEEMAAAMRKVPLLMIRAKDAAAIEAGLAALDES